MLMIRVVVAVRMRMAGAVRVHVLVFVEDDFQSASKRVRNTDSVARLGT
jgi:hypothetical protein